MSESRSSLLGAQSTSAGSSLPSNAIPALSALSIIGAIAGTIAITLRTVAPSPRQVIEQVMVSPAADGADGSRSFAVTWVVPRGEFFEGTAPTAYEGQGAPAYENTGSAPAAPRVMWGSALNELSNSLAADVATYSYSTWWPNGTSQSNYTCECVGRARVVEWLG